MWLSSHDGLIGELRKALSASSLRQKVIAHNLANFNTPGFSRYIVSFEEGLSQAQKGCRVSLKRTDSSHLEKDSGKNPVVEIDHSTARRVDGSNVDLESEMIDLVTNQIRYNAYVQQVNNRFSGWRYVINEGRR
ncbi:MAG: flagellar basal body rod protein FlgB [Firmicutes bacterium]|nr:flagellar basal body rod protein FlgB [Bacillota bacterium]